MRDYLAKRIDCINAWGGIGVMMFAIPSVSFFWAVYLRLPNGLWKVDGPIWLWWVSAAAVLLAVMPRVLYDLCRFADSAKGLFIRFRSTLKSLFQDEEVPDASSGTGGG